MKTLEEMEHRIVAQWLDLRPGVAWCHVPNGGKRDRITAARLKRLGVKPGVPDILVFSAPRKWPDRVGVALELKAPGGRVSEAQAAWMAALTQCRWLVYTAFGAKQALEILTELGY